MALPINPDKLTGKVKTDKWVQTVSKSFGASGEKMTEREAVEIPDSAVESF